jgi:DNA-binding response OmpR family regulator
MKRVLLIEPDQILADTYARAIEENVLTTVTSVSSAQAAIMAADENMPDLVVLELQLIEHSGIEFLYEFRSYSEWQSIPVIIHSIVPFSEFGGSWQLLKDELGVCEYLYKPHTTLRQLLRRIKEQSLIAA